MVGIRKERPAVTAVRRKPLLVGMNNPWSHRAKYALYPEPPGCTGHRIWLMVREHTGLDPDQYVAAFDRINLVCGPWSSAIARREAALLLECGTLRLRGPVILLGVQVARAFGISEGDPIRSCEADGVRFHCVPHPSGLNRWYNDPDNRRRVGLVLADAYYACGGEP